MAEGFPSAKKFNEKENRESNSLPTAMKIAMKNAFGDSFEKGKNERNKLSEKKHNTSVETQKKEVKNESDLKQQLNSLIDLQPQFDPTTFPSEDTTKIVSERESKKESASAKKEKKKSTEQKDGLSGLHAIFGEKIPAENIEMFEKLPVGMRGSYVEHIKKIHDEEVKKKQQKEQKQQKQREQKDQKSKTEKPRSEKKETVSSQKSQKSPEILEEVSVTTASVKELTTLEKQAALRAAVEKLEASLKTERSAEMNPPPIITTEGKINSDILSINVERNRIEKEIIASNSLEDDSRKKSHERVKYFNEGYLKNRDEELNKKVEKIGLEGHFRKLGERYGKINWKMKLGVGLALGLGAATFSTGAAFACMSGLALQRAAGMAHVFLATEKYLQWNAEKRAGSFIAKWISKKEVAMLGALLYTAGMGAAIGYSIQGWKEIAHLTNESKTDNLHEWLKQYWPFGQTNIAEKYSDKVTDIRLAGPLVGALNESVYEAPPSSGTQIDVPPQEQVSPKMPLVTATRGQGYEYMLKQMWERLHEQGVKPPEGMNAENSYPNSDLAKLLSADKDSIGKVVHEISNQSSHGFNADGSSAKISLGAHMTIDADGMVHVGAPTDSAVVSAESAQEPKSEFIRKDGSVNHDKIKSVLSNMNKAPVQQFASVPTEHFHATSKSIEELFKSNQEFENLGTHAPSELDKETISKSPAPLHTDESAPGFVQEAQPMEREFAHQSYASVRVESDVAPIDQTHFKVNSHNLSVGIDSAGSYTDEEGRRVIFGGSAVEREALAKEIVAKNHDAEVYFNSGDKDGHIRKVFFDPGSSWSLNPTPSEIKIVETLGDAVRPDDLTEVYKPHDNSIDNYNSLRSIPDTPVEHSKVLSGGVDIPMIEYSKEFINSNKISIDPLHGHIFQDKSGAIYAYGNAFSDRINAAQEFVKSHRDSVVWVQSEKPVLYNGELRPWALEVKYSGWGPLGSVQVVMPADGVPESQIGGIDPNKFTKQLDTILSSKTEPTVQAGASDVPSVEKLVKTDRLDDHFNHPERWNPRTLLEDNYKETIRSDESIKNPSLADSVVENRADKIFEYKKLVDGLIEKGEGASAEADSHRKSIRGIIKMTESKYGDVFKDLDVKYQLKK